MKIVDINCPRSSSDLTIAPFSNKLFISVSTIATEQEEMESHLEYSFEMGLKQKEF